MSNESISKLKLQKWKDDECHQPPPTKKVKVDYTDEEPKANRVHVVLSIPIIANRLHHNIDQYNIISWNSDSFDVILVYSKDEEKIVTDTVEQHSQYGIIPLIRLVNYSIPNSCPNAGITKKFAYENILINQISHLLFYS